MDIVFFETLSELHNWFEENYDKVKELQIGFYKKSAGKTGITYKEAVDEALCFGWIDGIRRKVDEESYVNRFTPRKPRSNWSEVNIKRVGELTAEGRMQPPGLKAFEARDKTEKQYSYEGTRSLDESYEAKFKEHEAAWAFFQAQPASYRRTASWFVMSAKREETRQKRLDTLIEDSENGRRLAQFNR